MILYFYYKNMIINVLIKIKTDTCPAALSLFGSKINNYFIFTCFYEKRARVCYAPFLRLKTGVIDLIEPLCNIANHRSDTIGIERRPQIGLLNQF